LVKHDTLGASLATVHQYLEQASQALRVLPTSEGRAGLMGLAAYLARQTDSLGACV